ncbi:DUF5666 domain-containing protein [Nocardioides humi]|uniref:DUF5666 domain-containing protein n=1 Tax=Nocardioides humi TaxID=449461 RepID=A0ABN2BLZ4_9ACTN|nr:DUF5666 domain-containing protein [Nocardioides humi]
MSLLLLRPLAAGAALAVLLTGCGDDEPATVASGTEGAPNAADGGGPGGADGAGGPGGMPGTFGQIAAVDGNVLQVRSQDAGQTAVTVTDSTTVTDQVAGTLADVEVGTCVVVRTDDTGTSTDEVAATSVSVSAGADGCTGGFGGGPGGGGAGGGGGGERPSGMPTDLPTDLPTDRPSGMPDGGGRPGGLGVMGEVTAVTDAGFVVEGRDGDVTVTVGAATTYTHQVDADATALTQGRCVRVQGDADDAGAVTATAIQVSDAVDDQCGR